MPAAAKPDHKSAFAALHAGLAPTFLGAGLNPHPVWQPGWDKDTVQHRAEYLAPPAPDGIRRVILTYGPADQGWAVLGLYHPCPDAAERLTAGTALGPGWAACLQGLPFRQNPLMPWKRRLVWRVWVNRQLHFDATGAPLALDATQTAILNGWPAFWKTLNRPGTV